MPKRKIIFLGSLVLVLGFGLVLFFPSSPKDKPMVSANISARDTAWLIHATRKKLQVEIFPDISWDSFKYLRERYRDYKVWEITEIKEPKPGVIRVVIEGQLGPMVGTLYRQHDYERTTNGWLFKPYDPLQVIP